MTEGDSRTFWGVRVVGNMLPMRVAAAGIHSVAGTAKLPLSFSPWGDNNPIQLANIRGRDILVHAGTLGAAHLIPGLDTFFDEVVEGVISSDMCTDVITDHVGECVIHIAAHLLEESGEDFVGNRLFLAARAGYMNTSLDGIRGITFSSVHKFRLNVHHKLYEKDAILSFVKLPSFRSLGILSGAASTGPGWFSPYIYATHRFPRISRFEPISFVELQGPSITADQILAFKLASLLTNITGRLVAFVDPNPQLDVGSSRALVCLIGVSPFRNLWSQCRRPNQCIMHFHALNNVPGIVIPVSPRCPLIAWHGKDLGELKSEDRNEVSDYVKGIAAPSLFATQEGIRQLEDAISHLVESAVRSKDQATALDKDLNLNRIGIAIFKYGQVVDRVRH